MHPFDKQTLDLMRPLRDPVCRVRAEMPLFKDARDFIVAIDKCSGVITGDAEYFWSRPASHRIGKKSV
jgi:hypothetical protein